MAQNTNSLIHDLLKPLSEKEREILELRFALAGGEKETLESIGKSFGLTRERVRQIEKNAIRKIGGMLIESPFGAMADTALERLKSAGGVLSHEDFVKLWPTADEKELHLAFVSHPDLHFHGNTLKTEPFWYAHPWTDSEVFSKIQGVVKELKKNQEVTSFAKAMLPLIRISKELKVIPGGVALFEWRHVNPRTLKDKILFVFRQEEKSMHFTKMADRVKAAGFDSKPVNPQAVHNELIRNNEFVLMGRGLYALREWGYESGTVGEVIEKILGDGKARTREEVTREVLKCRQVKTVTIHLNLKNNPKIERVGRDHYQLKKQ